MKAVRFYGISDVRVEEIEMVKPDSQQALVKIIYGGICGSDLHIFREGMFVEKVPETMGHEFIGRVVSVPPGTALKSGDLVIGDPRVPCNQCLACRSGDYHRCEALGFIGEVSPGGFAEYLAIKPEKLIRFENQIDLKQGALAEPLAVAVHACRNICETSVNKVLIAGAGPIGLLIAFLLKKQYNIPEVTVADLDAYRLDKAKVAGADYTTEQISEIKSEYDCAVDAIGSPAVLNHILNSVKPGGKVYISAIYEKLPIVDINYIVGNELSIKGNNAYSFDDLKMAVNIIDDCQYDLSWIISRIIPIYDAPTGFEMLVSKNKQDLKILIDMQS